MGHHPPKKVKKNGQIFFAKKKRKTTINSDNILIGFIIYVEIFYSKKNWR